MAAQHSEQHQDGRTGPVGRSFQERRATVPPGPAARWIDEDAGEPWSGRGFSFTRPPARRRPDRDDDEHGGSERRRSARRS